jgi:hypothetical protein
VDAAAELQFSRVATIRGAFGAFADPSIRLPVTVPSYSVFPTVTVIVAPRRRPFTSLGAPVLGVYVPSTI